MKTFHTLLLSTTLVYATQSTDSLSIKDENLQQKENISIHGHYRGRVESYNGVNKVSYGDYSIDASNNIRGKSSDLLYLQQIILGFDYKISDDWNMKAYMYDSRVAGSSIKPEDFTKNKNTPDMYRMSFYEDYFELFETYIRNNSFINENITLTVGRQQLGYGDRRIFGPGKWGNTIGWLWDAIHLSYKKEKNYLDVWYGQTRIKDENDFSILEKHRYQGVGIYGHYQINNITVEPFGVWRNNLYHKVKPELNYYYAGTRIFDLHPGFIYDVTGLLQKGKYGQNDVEAYAYAAKAGYKTDSALMPTFTIGYVFASGDKDPNDTKMQTFTTPFGANDGSHYGRMDLMIWSNMNDMQAKLSIKPLTKMDIQFEYHHFNLENANDKWYTFKYANNPGNSFTHIGDEIDFITKYKLSKEIDLLGIFAYFKAGDFIKKNDIAQNNSTKAFFQFTYKW